MNVFDSSSEPKGTKRSPQVQLLPAGSRSVNGLRLKVVACQRRKREEEEAD